MEDDRRNTLDMLGDSNEDSTSHDNRRDTLDMLGGSSSSDSSSDSSSEDEYLENQTLALTNNNSPAPIQQNTTTQSDNEDEISFNPNSSTVDDDDETESDDDDVPAFSAAGFAASASKVKVPANINTSSSSTSSTSSSTSSQQQPSRSSPSERTVDLAMLDDQGPPPAPMPLEKPQMIEMPPPPPQQQTHPLKSALKQSTKSSRRVSVSFSPSTQGAGRVPVIHPNPGSANAAAASSSSSSSASSSTTTSTSTIPSTTSTTNSSSSILPPRTTTKLGTPLFDDQDDASLSPPNVDNHLASLLASGAAPIGVVLRIRPEGSENDENAPSSPLVREMENSILRQTSSSSVTVTAPFNFAASSSGYGQTPSKNQTSRHNAASTPRRPLGTPSRSGTNTPGGGTTAAGWRTPRRPKPRTYHYDHVLGSTSKQEDVFRAVVPLVDCVATGKRNATILASGATGCGKTHTIMGTAETPGVLPRAVARMFRRLHAKSNPHRHYRVLLTYVELYRNRFVDLLSDIDDDRSSTSSSSSHNVAWSTSKSSGLGRSYGGGRMSLGRQSSSGLHGSNGAQQSIELHESKSRGIFLTGGDTLETEVNSVEEALACVRAGNLRRATSSTDANARSSRSHAIVTIHVEFAHPRDPTRIGKRSKLHIIDLAGSERVSVSGATGARLQEAQAINLSLTALSNVLMALSSSKTRGATKSGDNHLWLVPYRNSKLTHLLKDSLGGTALTIFLAHVRSTPEQYRQTMLTLDYASRAKTIKNRAPPTPSGLSSSSSSSSNGTNFVSSDVHARMLSEKQLEMDTLSFRLKTQTKKLFEMREIESKAVHEAMEQREKLDMLAAALSKAKQTSMYANEKTKNYENELLILNQDLEKRRDLLEKERNKCLRLENEQTNHALNALNRQMQDKEMLATNQRLTQEVEEATSIATEAVEAAEEAESKITRLENQVEEHQQNIPVAIATMEFGTQVELSKQIQTTEMATSPIPQKDTTTSTSSTSTSPMPTNTTTTGTSTTPLPTSIHMSTSPIPQNSTTTTTTGTSTTPLPTSNSSSSSSSSSTSTSTSTSTSPFTTTPATPFNEETHHSQLFNIEKEYNEKSTVLLLELKEARAIATTKTTQYEHASKRAHQQRVLLSSELVRTERAIEAQRELCDHLQSETIKTKQSMHQREEEHLYSMSILTHETTMEMARRDQVQVVLKRKLLKMQLNDMKQQDAMKRMKRIHKKTMTNSHRSTKKLEHSIYKITNELSKQYTQNDVDTRTIRKTKERLNMMEDALDQSKSKSERLALTLDISTKQSEKLNDNVIRLQKELVTSKSESNAAYSTINKMTDDIKSLEEEKAKVMSEMMDNVVDQEKRTEHLVDEEMYRTSEARRELLEEKTTKQKVKIKNLKLALNKFREIVNNQNDEVEEDVVEEEVVEEEVVVENVEEEQPVKNVAAVPQQEEEVEEEQEEVVEAVEEVVEEVVAPPSSTKKRKKSTKKSSKKSSKKSTKKSTKKTAMKKSVEEEEQQQEEEESINNVEQVDIVEEEQQQPSKKRKKTPKKRASKKTTKAPKIYTENQTDDQNVDAASVAAPVAASVAAPAPRRSARKRKPATSSTTKKPLSSRKKKKTKTDTNTKQETEIEKVKAPVVAVKKKKARRKKKLRSNKAAGVGDIFKMQANTNGGVVMPKLKTNASLFEGSSENNKNRTRAI